MTGRARLDIARDALALLIAKSAFIALRLSVLYLYARQVDSASFGPVALAMTAAEVSRFVGDWGCDTLSLRKFSVPVADEARAVLRWVLRLRIPSSLVALLVALSSIRLLAGVTDPVTMLLIAMTAVTSLWLNTAVNWLQARQALRGFSLILAAIGLMSVAAQLAITGLCGSLHVRLSALLLCEGAMIVAGLGRLPRLSEMPTPIALNKRLGPWLRESTPIAVAALLAMIYTRFDQFFLGHTEPGEVLGSYTLAIRLVEPLFFIAAAMSSTIYVRASGLMHTRGDTAIGTIASRWVVATAMLAASLAAVTAALGTWALPRFLPGYAHADTFLDIALVGLVFRACNLCLTAFLQALGHYRLMMKISMLNLVLVPIYVLAGSACYGATGVAIAMVLADATNTSVQTIRLRAITRHSRSIAT